MDRDSIKKLAEQKCNVNSNRLALIFFIYSIISGAISISSGNSQNISGAELSISFSLNILLAGPLTYGLINAIKINYEGRCPEVESLFSGFKFFWKLLLLNFLMNLYIFLWTLLFIIPGIVKAYSYSMAYYVFLDDPKLSPSECLRRSEAMTAGFKMELFKLHLSYLGWLILSVLTLGILYFWVGPKIQTAQYEYYLILSGKKKRKLESEILEEDQYKVDFD